MHYRIAAISPRCQRCQEDNEYEMHCLFYCNISRQVWFGSPLGVRVHELPLDIVATVHQLVSRLDEDGVLTLYTTMWEIWKERNKAVIEHADFKPQQVLQRVNVQLRPELTAGEFEQRNMRCTMEERYDIHQEGWQVLVDGSWEESGRAGGAYIVYEKGQVHSVGMHSFRVQDAFHAEAMALYEAMRYVFNQEPGTPGMKVQFFSDCQGLVLAVNNTDVADLPSWRATRVTNQIIRQMDQSGREATLQFARREALNQPHNLANIARRNGINYQGLPHMALQQQGRLSNHIDGNFFQRVQERPP
ncbi:hypothetical protein LUZ62_018913 [Rhynchospora pubera]|uniref:RNase H type-1 domain-containing protein n=1 Tax=Rhynchospora pubera TaxID=906938 RepID=A0AAV8GLZ9_9POAL|nr:hypothetical protein LUZ62_018913 [Rhynchospora pubera]